MIRWYMYGCIACVSAAALAGCSSTGRDDFATVQQSAQARGLAVRWNQSTADDDAAAASVAKLLAAPLSRESAVQVALLNNRSLQATFEDIGVAQADLVQAGLLKNPVFDIDFKFIQGGGKPHIEAAVAEDFLSILQLPLRKKLAEANLQAATLRVSNEVLMLAAKTEQAYVILQAAQQMLELRKQVELATAASAEAANQLHAAGNVDDLKLATEQATHEQAALDVRSAEANVAITREQLNELMGVATAPAWTVADRLPALPAGEADEASLAKQAMNQRPDLAAMDVQAQAAARVLGIAKWQWLDGADVGAMAERDHGGSWQAGPAVSVPIPLFDSGQGARARAAAELRRAQQLHAAKVVEIRAAVRSDLARVAAARARVESYEHTLLPLRKKIVDQTQRLYNGMYVGVFDLLNARQAEIDTGTQYLDALKDYWLARSDLAYTVGGSLPQVATPASQLATKPAEKMDMKMNMKMK